ncbi:MAG: hypothetical protein AB9903_18700 [Vulcanimicrobiota bacterium]
MIDKSSAIGATPYHLSTAAQTKVKNQESAAKNDSVTLSSQDKSPDVDSTQNNLIGKLVPMGQCEVKPELKPGTLAMIKDLHDIQNQGQGALPLRTILDSFGMQLTPEQQQLVEKRGDLEFKSTAESGGTFINKGEKIKLSVEGADIIIPREVSGSYDSTDGSFAFHFAPKKTISACKLFLCADLENLFADSKRINVDMAGTLFDSCIVFEPSK